MCLTMYKSLQNSMKCHNCQKSAWLNFNFDHNWPHFIPFWPNWPLGALKIELHPMGQWGMVPISTNWGGLTIFEIKSLPITSQKLAIVSHFEFSSEFNHQLNTLLLLCINQMSYFLELSRLRQFFPNFWDTFQDSNSRNTDVSFFKFPFLEILHFDRFHQLIWLFLSWITPKNLFQWLY